MDLSIVIPCYNESEVAPALVAALNKTFQMTDLSVQLIFVDDGSTDGTAEILRQLVKVMENTHIRADVIEFSRNFGKEAALFAGLRAAEGTICGIMDGDFLCLLVTATFQTIGEAAAAFLGCDGCAAELYFNTLS